jgi:exodeoxyribonuclease VIII
LEPEKWAETAAVAPVVDRRTKAGREEYAAFVAENEGKAVVTAADMEIINGVTKAVRGCGLTKFLVNAAGPVEVPHTWVDNVTGLACRSRPDKWIPDASTVVDLKTTRDAAPWAFSKSIGQYGYDLQSCHYVSGLDAKRHVWIVVSTEPPHEVGVFEMDAASLERAQGIYRRTMGELAEAIETGDWHLEPKAIQTIELPGWVE